MLCDQEGVCRFLKLKDTPKFLRGNNGNKKMNDLYGMVKKVYPKGYRTKELVSALDMSVIRDKNKDVLIPPARTFRARGERGEELAVSSWCAGGRRVR